MRTPCVKEKSIRSSTLKSETLKFATLKIFLGVIVKASVIEFTFCKNPCFQHVLMNNFRRIRLKYASYSLIGILFSAFKQHSGYNGDVMLYLHEATKALLQRFSMEIH